MLNYRSMARSSSKRRDALQERIASTKEELVAMEAELKILDQILAALPSGTVKRGPGRPRGGKKAGRRTRGTWKPGGRGRPPRWYVERQKGREKPAKKAAKAKKAPRRKRTVSPKVLASLARARAARAEKRKAAASAGQPPA